MPITAFNSVSDGLVPHQRSREHFIADIDLEDGPHWIPYTDGVWIQLCQFNVTSGGFSVVLKGLPGTALGTHYHIGTVRGVTLRGNWRTCNMTGLRSPARSLARKYYREVGLDARPLDALVR
jgi:desulfoferrodoxin (superoxide reductase-like protein)